jgi:hypothetical protein
MLDNMIDLIFHTLGDYSRQQLGVGIALWSLSVAVGRVRNTAIAIGVFPNYNLHYCSPNATDEVAPSSRVEASSS